MHLCLIIMSEAHVFEDFAGGDERIKQYTISRDVRVVSLKPKAHIHRNVNSFYSKPTEAVKAQ